MELTYLECPLFSRFTAKHTKSIITFALHTHPTRFSSAQLLSHFWLFATPWTALHQASLSITHSWSLLKLMFIKLVMSSNLLILQHPLLLLPSIFPSIRVFSNESVLCSGGQSTGVSASASVFPMNIQDWFPLGLNGLIFLPFKGLIRIFSSTTIWKHQYLSIQPSLQYSSHIHTWLLEKPQLWPYRPWSAKWCLCFLILSLGL